MHNIDILSLQINHNSNLDKTAKEVKKLIGLRVTIINGKGVVVGESDNDYKKMDNHKNRNEVIESAYQKYGSIIRYSDTLNKDLLYVSKKFIYGKKIYYVRMARNLEQINEQFISIGYKVALLFLIFMAISFWVALRISKQLQDETKEILKFLNNLTKQDSATMIQSNYSIEFDKITKILTKVSATLHKKDKLKQKYTAKLKFSNRQKDDIIAAISHEFKNPIAVISGYSQTILDDKEINPNIRNKFLEKIFSNSKKLTNMIDRLRLSIKLEAQKDNSTFTKCDLKKMTVTIIEDLKLSYVGREIILNASELIVEADETMLSIAITNLIENALKYSQDSVEVVVDNNALSVIDTGIGVKITDIPRITEKFYRVSNNGWNNSLGVGLSLVNSILNIHNFKLDIQSVENEGSTFKILF